MNVSCFSIFTIALVLLSGIPSISGIGSTISYANAKYSNSQVQSFVNECGHDESSGINCVASGLQTQADGSATATPIVSNVVGQGQQGPPGPPGPQGPPGPDKELQVRTIIPSEGVGVEAGESAVVEAQCAPDEVVTGGGTSYVPVDPTANEINPLELDLATPDGWGFRVDNPGPSDVGISTFAQCAKLVDVP
jgi:hypothetical protein